MEPPLPFVKLSRTVLRTFQQAILASVSTGLSNGLVEGFNNKKRLTRRALGFHSVAGGRARRRLRGMELMGVPLSS